MPRQPASSSPPRFCGGHVAVLVAHVVDLAQARGQRLVVFAQLGEHIFGNDVLGIVVEHTLQPRDVPDRGDRGPADFADTLGDQIGHGEDLIRLLVEQQVVTRKCGPLRCQWKFLVFT